MRWKIILALICLYFVYLLMGAAVFYALEFNYEEQRCLATIAELQTFNLTNSSGNIRSLARLLLTASQNGVQFDSSLTPSCVHNWNYQNAFFFAGTVVTTIGYGNISPKTAGGQIFCIFFATCGLPIFGIMFSGIGDKIAKVFKSLDRRLKKKGRNTKLRKAIVLFATVTALLVFFLLIPSAIFSTIEDWNYRESFYYSFITLTTIGFGDFVVGNNPDKSYISIYRIGVYFWILFGLAFMATVISLTGDIIKEKATNKQKVKDSASKNEESCSEVQEMNNKNERCASGLTGAQYLEETNTNKLGASNSEEIRSNSNNDVTNASVDQLLENKENQAVHMNQSYQSES